MPIIDFHNHFYPPAYLDALRSGSSAVEVTIDEDGNPRIYYPGDYNIAVPGHRDIDYREQVLIAHGVDTQVLTLTTPGTHVETPATAASVRELDRACRQLHFPGAMLFSNVNGAGLNEPQFWPIYELANDLGATLYIHPTHPVGVEAMTDFWLMPLVGFLMDTTLAAAKLVFSGIPERFPRIRWALCHLGGAIPYLAERLDRGFEAFTECRAHIPRPPSTYLKQFYYDTVNFNPQAIQLAIDFAGIDHLVAGSDYPHQIGSSPKMIETVGPNADLYAATARRLL